MEYENLPTDSSIQNTDNPHDRLLTEFRGRKHFRMNVLHIVVTLLFSFLFFYVLFGSTDPPRLNPVIFVPGDGGSRVEAKLNKTSTVHYICDKTTSNWFTLWLNLELLVPEVIDCFIDNLRLTYDNVTRTTSNSPGVSIRIPEFGHTDAVEWLDPSVRVGSYFSPIADALSKLSYERDLSLRGAPYDFRKAPNEHSSYFVNLKALIEETYDLNGSTPVVLLAHSMGSLMCLYFLQRQSSASDEHTSYFVNLKALIEETYDLNGSTPVVLLAHSMGSLMCLYFLQRQSSASDEHTSYFVNLKALIEETYDLNGSTPVVLLAHSMGSLMCLYFLQRQSGAGDEHSSYFVNLKALIEETYDLNGSTPVVLLAHSMGSLMCLYFLQRRSSASDEHSSYFVNLKALIEETYDLNGSTPVVLLAHSMGSLMCLYFLQRQSAAWKSKFIRSLVTLAAPWGGSVKAVKVFAVGDDLGVYVLSKSTLKVYQVTCPSTAWLLPSPHFWSPEEVLVETPEKNYTMANLRDYFQDLDNMQGWEMRQDVEQYALDLRPPGVEVHCLHGLHVSTPKKLVYSSAGKFPASPQYEMDDGDGTVNLRSLRGCLAWAGRQSPPLFHREFPGADHMSLLGDKALLSYLTELLRLPQPRPSLLRRVRQLFHL